MSTMQGAKTADLIVRSGQSPSYSPASFMHYLLICKLGVLTCGLQTVGVRHVTCHFLQGKVVVELGVTLDNKLAIQ
jgi:hypothetical protein